MPGDMQDVEMPIAKIDDVALLDEPRRWRGPHAITCLVESARRQSLEHLERRVASGERCIGRGCREDICLESVAGSFGEFVVIANVIEMRMAGNREKRLVGEPRELFDEAYDARP